MRAEKESTSPREKILDKAQELFYAQGYQSTGINQIIAESGVAKATFYAHFPSKDALCVAYLERMSDREAQLLEATLSKRRSALSRYMAPIEILESWLTQTDFRGCPFLNIASEVCEHESPMRLVGIKFYRDTQRLVERSVRELKDSDPKRYSSLVPGDVASRYMTIFVGAIGMSQISRSIEPIRKGIQMAKELVDV